MYINIILVILTGVVNIFQSISYKQNKHEEKGRQKILVKSNKIDLASNLFKIQVITKYIKDSTNKNESLDLYPLIIEQKIQLLYKNLIVKELNHNVHKIRVLSAHNGYIKILENHIVDIGIIDGKNEIFYCINGYGGCSTCSEYSTIINCRGEIVYLLYKDFFRTLSRKGALSKVLNLYGIDRNTYSRRQYRKKQLLF